jgi:hypothetical protein
MHAETLLGEFFDARGKRPRARLELELAPFDVERLGAGLLALDPGKELARLVLRSDQAERARSEQRQQEQGGPHHVGTLT